MALFQLKVLGLTDEDIIGLAKAAHLQHDQYHPKAGLQTTCHCICGAFTGGPAGSPACRALAALEKAAKEMSRLKNEKQLTNG